MQRGSLRDIGADPRQDEHTNRYNPSAAANRYNPSAAANRYNPMAAAIMGHDLCRSSSQ